MRKLKEKPVFESVSRDVHPEHQTRNTRVSEYLRKYGQGRIDSMPTDNRPLVTDNRSVDEMLSDPDKLTSSLGTDELDVLVEMQQKADDFEAAFKDIELTRKQKEKFDAAIRVLRDKNASYDQLSDASRIIEELEQAKKVTRARV